MSAPQLTRITAQDAENDPPEGRTFAEPKTPAFDVEPVYYYPQITMRATVHHRGRDITVVAADMSADQFCDVLDKRFGPPAPNAPAPAAAAPAEEAWQAVCPYHGPMKESTIKGKEGTYYCPKKMADDSYCKERWPKR